MGLFSTKTTIPASGFYALPTAYKQSYGDILGKINTLTGQNNSSAFTPMAQTSDETTAFNRIRQGLTPTTESLQADISMLTNPFDSYVIDEMNRQAAGKNSLVNQNASRAGQIGSNRSFLGTSDIEQNRLNNIGQFKQSQYNNAIQTALGQLAGLKQQDISNLMGVGSFQRGLDSATKQAPYAEASADQGLLNGVQTSFGNFGSPAQTIKSGGGLGGILKAVAPMALNYLAPGLGTAFGAATGGGIGGALASFAAGSGLTGGLDSSTGITWNGGNYGWF